MLGFMEVLYTITMAKLRLSQSTAEDPPPTPTPHSHARVHTNSTQSSQYWAPYFRTDSRPTVTPWKLYPVFFLTTIVLVVTYRILHEFICLCACILGQYIYSRKQQTTNKTKRTTTTKQQMLALKSTSCCNKELVPPSFPTPLIILFIFLFFAAVAMYFELSFVCSITYSFITAKLRTHSKYPTSIRESLQPHLLQSICPT